MMMRLNDDWLTGDLQIGVPMGVGEDRVIVSVSDSRSGIAFLQLEVSPANLLLAIAGRGLLEGCRFLLRNPAGVGKYRELKHEEVFVPVGHDDKGDERAQAAIAEFEKDGWRGSLLDALNSHCCVAHTTEGNTYRVSFTRLVDEPPKGGEQNEANPE